MKDAAKRSLTPYTGADSYCGELPKDIEVEIPRLTPFECIHPSHSPRLLAKHVNVKNNRSKTQITHFP